MIRAALIWLALAVPAVAQTVPEDGLAAASAFAEAVREGDSATEFALIPEARAESLASAAGLEVEAMRAAFESGELAMGARPYETRPDEATGGITAGGTEWVSIPASQKVVDGQGGFVMRIDFDIVAFRPPGGDWAVMDTQFVPMPEVWVSVIPALEGVPLPALRTVVEEDG